MQKTLLRVGVVSLCLSAFACSPPETTTEAPKQTASTQAQPVELSPPDLARTSGCLACHATDRRMIGPAWQDVAAKYQDDKGARNRLIEKVKQGGAGVWGDVPMPGQSPQLSDEKIAKLVDYALSLSK